MNQIVNDWELNDGQLSFQKLSSTTQTGILDATADMIAFCNQLNYNPPLEMEVIEDPSHPFYISFSRLVCGYIQVYQSNHTRSFHSLRDSLKRTWLLNAARIEMKQTVRIAAKPY